MGTNFRNVTWQYIDFFFMYNFYRYTCLWNSVAVKGTSQQPLRFQLYFSRPNFDVFVKMVEYIYRGGKIVFPIKHKQIQVEILLQVIEVLSFVIQVKSKKWEANFGPLQIRLLAGEVCRDSCRPLRHGGDERAAQW